MVPEKGIEKVEGDEWDQMLQLFSACTPDLTTLTRPDRRLDTEAISDCVQLFSIESVR